eukprot:TRINITY_DN1062_c0_g1_i1.p1 TRINITY_DN1062_c0_g1~~TRINITY_DN1062_c0_g1_i1.p1  ORF type:complete len:251 (+),score=71.45 TRINITY_DN1062_c0_g1_i1:70-822(+)
MDFVNSFVEGASSTSGKHYGSSLFTENIRLGFVRKVLGIVACQLLVTFNAVLITNHFQVFQQLHALHNVLMVTALLAGIATSCALGFSNSFARTSPTNYILLAIFTAAESYLVSALAANYPFKIVAAALALTMTITIVLFLYAMTTKKDISYFGALLFMMSAGLCLFSILAIFIRSYFLELLLSLGGAMFYGVYLIYDIQLIIGGKRFEIGVDDYIRASITIYIDIIRIFIEVLRILGKDKDNNKDNRKR